MYKVMVFIIDCYVTYKYDFRKYRTPGCYKNVKDGNIFFKYGLFFRNHKSPVIILLVLDTSHYQLPLHK